MLLLLPSQQHYCTEGTEPGSMTDVCSVKMVKQVFVLCCGFSDDRVVIENGMFSWSEDDPSVLKEFVF